MKKDQTKIETSNYASNYNESAFWKVVKKMGAKVARPALLLFYELKDPNIPVKAKMEIIGALGYLIAPVDLIPDGIPGLGYTDDLAALVATVSLTSQYITPKVKRQANEKLRDWFGEYDEYDDVA